MNEINKRFWRPLKINPEYAKLVPKLSAADYKELEDSIVENKGAFESIKINLKDEILDGHHRYEICSKHGLGFTTELVELPTVLDERIYVIETNLKRRQLNQFQSIELNLILDPLLREKGRQKESEAGKIGRNIQLGVVPEDTTPETPKVDSLGTIAEKSKAGRVTVAKVKKILAKAPENVINEVRQGKKTIASAYAQIQETERQEERNQALAETSANIPEGITLIQGDFAQVDVKDESIQLILTDLPYPEEYLDLWGKLGKFAKDKLVPGGYLVTYCGHFHLPEVLEKLKLHLQYFWIMALTQPQHVLVHSRHVFCDWKPILVFYKPPLVLPEYFGDVIKGAGREKEHHEWQQGQAELEHIIKTFCPPNGVILDPACGTGTVLLAAKQWGRKVIGIESNPETFATMRKRLEVHENAKL